MIRTEGGEKQAHTLLGDEFYQGNESDVRWGSHGMVQKNTTESDAVLVAEDDRTSCTQTHPVGFCQF